jgi:hypothetical protein
VTATAKRVLVQTQLPTERSLVIGEVDELTGLDDVE